MKIVVDMQKMSNLHSGLGQFCFHLGNELLNQKKDEKLLFLGEKNDAFKDKIEFYEPTLIDKIIGNWPEKIDLWHCTHQEPKFLPENVPYILTIHDLNFLYKYKSEWRINIKKKKLQKLINKSSAVVAVSEFTLKEINNHFLIPVILQKVIYNGISLNNSTTEKKPEYAPNKPFMFTIGIISPKKNFHVLVPFIKELDYSLIIAGDKKSDYAKEIAELAEKTGVTEKIIMPGKISEEEKVWLYKNCAAFVFPSLSEGFGLPVVEAMSLGKPVFLSDKTSLPEIGGDAAFYLPDFNAVNMAEVFKNKMQLFNNDDAFKNKLIMQSQKFSWKNAARQYLDLYSAVANKKDKIH